MLFDIDNKNRAKDNNKIKIKKEVQNTNVSKQTINQRIKKSTNNNNSKQKLKTIL